MGWPLLSVADLTEDDVDRHLSLADRLRDGTETPPTLTGTVALLFFEPSLRTRTGFTVAAHQLGLGPVEVYEPRHSPTSQPESWGDTLRVVADAVDVVVARPGAALDRAETVAQCVCPVINAGDQGPTAEHPTQALVDLFAIRTLAAPGATSIVIIGDPRMRAPRSLVRMLDMMTSYDVTIIADPEYLDHETRRFLESHNVRAASTDDLVDLTPDVLYVAGMPHQSLPLDRREALIVNKHKIRSLPRSTIILSPMPVIDEIDEDVRGDARVKIFEQSRLGRFVRTALLISAFDAAT